ncbi:MAG TPA: hypothetical protein PJ983_11880, partial [Flavobacteriales bacterium]|nr:hypothetical protein [Flavobacteriales bacterium]
VAGEAAVVVPLGASRRDARDRFADALASVLASEPERASLRARGLVTLGRGHIELHPEAMDAKSRG